MLIDEAGEDWPTQNPIEGKIVAQRKLSAQGMQCAKTMPQTIKNYNESILNFKLCLGYIKKRIKFKMKIYIKIIIVQQNRTNKT